MTLATWETWRGGFVVNAITGATTTTLDATNATTRGGFLRDPDGRLVVAV